MGQKKLVQGVSYRINSSFGSPDVDIEPSQFGAQSNGVANSRSHRSCNYFGANSFEQEIDGSLLFERIQQNHLLGILLSDIRYRYCEYVFITLTVIEETAKDIYLNIKQ